MLPSRASSSSTRWTRSRRAGLASRTATRRPARPLEDARRHDRHGATRGRLETSCTSLASPFDTSQVLFICGGAFVGLEDIIAKRLGRGFGFGQVAENHQVSGLLRQVKPEDLEAFGLIPELIGRLPVIAPLDALGVDDLARILSFDEGIVDPAVQEAGQVPRCGSGVHGCGGQGDRQDRAGAWDGSQGASSRWSRRSWRGFCSTPRRG